MSPDRHRRLPVLQESCPSHFGASLSVRPGNQGRGNDRIIKVERKTLIGDAWRFEETLRDSEDSSKRNTSFVERLNLTIRQGSAYLFRWKIYHARWKERLEDHLELLRCYYNFVRPQMALKFGREMRTPAIQAGLTTRRLTLREIFPSAMLRWFSERVSSGNRPSWSLSMRREYPAGNNN